MSSLKKYFIVFILLVLSGCIAAPGMSPMAIPPLTNTMSGDPHLYTGQYTLKEKKFVYSSNSGWVKLASVGGGEPVKYQIQIAGSGASVGSSSEYSSGKGVSQNNVLSLCYAYTDTSSTGIANQGISNLFGTQSNSLNNCQKIGLNPNTQSNDCIGDVNFVNVQSNRTNQEASVSSEGTKLYVVLENGAHFDTNTVYTGGGIKNNCPSNFGSLVLSRDGCVASDKRCNEVCSGIQSNNVACVSQVVSPWLYSNIWTRGEPKCSSFCACDSAYEGGGNISESFAKGECLFANGMGYTFGYGNQLANLHSGNQMFSNALDPETMIFQNSEIIDLQACEGANCGLNFSLAGSATSSYTNNDTDPFSRDYITFPKNSSRQDFQKSTYFKQKQSNTIYAIGINNTSAECSEQVASPAYRTYLFAEKSGCYAIGGQPTNPIDQQKGNGKLEYLFLASGSKPPADSSNGQGTIDSLDKNGFFYTMKGVSNQSKGQDLYVRIKDTGLRSDNYGYYEVNYYEMNQAKYGLLGKIISYVANPVQVQVLNVSEQFFSNVANSPTFLTIINAMVTLYITLFGASFLMGNTKITQKELVSRLFKIGVVMVFMNNQTSTAFFNQYLLNLFWNGMTDLISYVTGTKFIVNSTTGQHQLDYQAIFAFSDSVIGSFFSSSFITILATLLFWIPVGWIILILMIKGILIYLKALIVAIISYLIALTAVGLFIAMAPIFIVLVLFDRTRDIFNNWIQVMTSFVFQPVIMFASIAVINQLMQTIIYDFTSLSVSLSKILSITLPIGSVKIPLLDIYWWMPVYSLMTLMVLIVIFNIFCEILKQTPQFASELSNGLFATGAGSSAGAVAGTANNMAVNNPALYAVGADQNTQNKIAGEEGKANRTSGATQDGQKQGEKDIKEAKTKDSPPAKEK